MNQFFIKVFISFIFIFDSGYSELCNGNFKEEKITYLTVSTSRGDVTGYHVDHGNDRSQMFYGSGDVFLGIPYVEPPIGVNRWKKPIALKSNPVSPWNATYNRPACPQLGKTDVSEDCLYLSVYTPDAKSTNRFPVMVWIYGGALKGGSISEYPTEGIIRNFISRGVVLVSIQYRISALGFFTTFTDDFPPNRGMLDQVEGIKWIKEEISNFGGNPYQMTLFGQSAGSASVSAHTLSPLTQNLFQQAIMESGSVLTCFDGSLGFQNTSVDLAASLCNFTKTDWNTFNYTRLIDCMANISYEKLIEPDVNLLMGWQMVQDNLFLPDTPANLAKNRPNIPVIYGNCKDEWALWELDFLKNGVIKLTNFNKKTFELFFSVVAKFLSSHMSDVENILEKVYVKLGTADDDYNEWIKIQNYIFTSAAFTGFITRELRWQLESGNNRVYTYELTYATDIDRPFMLPNWKPVYHSEDLRFIFMKKDKWNEAATKGYLRNDDFLVANFFADSWTNFAKYGQPSLNSSFWSPTTSAMNYMDINPIFQMKNNYKQVDDAVWNLILPPLIGIWPPDRPYYGNGTNANMIENVQWRKRLISNDF